jgi:acyl-coenzyme A synthetase/AMP-(fatty) acid ligase
MFTAPTAIRAIRKEDPNGNFIKQYDLSSLKPILAGERLSQPFPMANMLGGKLYPLNPVPWVTFVVMILKYLMKKEMKCKQSTRICGGKTPTTSRNVA